MNEYKTTDGRVVTDEMLEAEAQLFEKGERPPVWEDVELQDVAERESEQE